jgi:hypothetical protein
MENFEIKIAIASHVDYANKTLPILLNSLISNNIEKENITVFISGYDRQHQKIDDGIKYRYLDFNSFELSPLIDIVEHELRSEYWFLVHDTCKAGPNFKKLLYNIPENRPVKLAAKDPTSMSIGLYSYEYLLSLKDKILSVKNKDYSEEGLKRCKKWHVLNEDYILWREEPAPYIYNQNSSEWEVVDDINWYDSDTIRRTEYLHSLDLYKSKSNWGQSTDYTYTI